MRKVTPFVFLLTLFCQGVLLAADPTALRVWTSQKGTTVVARATGLSGGMVSLSKRGGSKITLKLSELSVQDQLIIKNHFVDESVPAEGGDEPDPDFIPEEEDFEEDPLDEVPEDLAGALGEFRGPMKASQGSSYYIYLPTTLVKGQKAPLVFWTGHHNGQAKTLKFLQDGAEITGTVLAASVEAKSGGQETHQVNLEHAKDCLQHISLNFPVETKWVFFAGNDRGGASAFYNADRFRCAGAFTINAYIPKRTAANARGYYFVASGTQHHNRYRSAHAVNLIGTYGTHYIYPGGVRFPKSNVGTQGMIWLYTRHLYSQRRLRSAEAKRFEKRFGEWLESHIAPWETYYFCEHLLKTCDVEGEFRDFILKLQARLAKEEPDAIKYLEGRKALARFSEKVYAGYGGLDLSLHGHTTPKIENEVEKLKEDFGDVPDLGDIITKMAFPTH